MDREDLGYLITLHGPNPQEVGAEDGTEDDYGDLLNDAWDFLGYGDFEDARWQRFQTAAQNSTATSMEVWLAEIAEAMK